MDFQADLRRFALEQLEHYGVKYRKKDDLTFFQKFLFAVHADVNLIFIAINDFPEIMFFRGKRIVFQKFLIVNGDDF